MAEVAFPHLMQPFEIGRMKLRNRIMMPPHGLVVGDPFGSEAESLRSLAYWKSRAEDGVAWIDGLNGFIANRVIPPGFVPTGVGAVVNGVFRKKIFRERAGRMADTLHEAGAVCTVQLIFQGGLPHTASGILANYVNTAGMHVLTRDEIRYFIDEYVFAAQESHAAGFDGVEIHANHEDVLELFMSAATNRREDEYGGDREGRLRIIKEVAEGIRAATSRDFVIGLRMNMDEFFEGGYDLAEGLEIARSLEATGNIDYFHGVIGNNWGAPSYVQPHHFASAQWAPMAGEFKKTLSLPIVYTGRVTHPQAGEDAIAAGHCDVVGMARAMFADGEVVSKARAGRAADIRPCIGTNDCLHGAIVEGIPFGCSVNPRAGKEAEPAPPRAAAPRRILVVGGGPAGMEVAALAAERGHEVALWERAEALGGQMRIAQHVPENASYARFIAFQERRLQKAGVALSLSREAGVEDVIAHGADVVVAATGAASRRPEIEGLDLPFVLDGRDVMLGKAKAGGRALVIAMEDHMQPLTIASYLVDQGVKTRVFYPSPGIAPLVGKYSIGGVLAKLTAQGAEFRVMERIAKIAPGRVTVKNVYSGVAHEVTDFDFVVLACGGASESGLYEALKARGQEAHILGDAFVPRRILFATRQAYALAAKL